MATMNLRFSFCMSPSRLFLGNKQFILQKLLFFNEIIAVLDLKFRAMFNIFGLVHNVKTFSNVDYYNMIIFSKNNNYMQYWFLIKKYMLYLIENE